MSLIFRQQDVSSFDGQYALVGRVSTMRSLPRRGLLCDHAPRRMVWIRDTPRTKQIRVIFRLLCDLYVMKDESSAADYAFRGLLSDPWTTNVLPLRPTTGRIQLRLRTYRCFPSSKLLSFNQTRPYVVCPHIWNHTFLILPSLFVSRLSLST